VIRALVYADVDLNLIDGSSVWLASLVELLASSGRVHVTVLRRTRPTRSTVIASIEGNPSVELVDPWAAAANDPRFASLLNFNAGGRLHNATAAAFVRALDKEFSFDLILVRGPETAAILGGFPEIADRLWVYVADPLRQRRAGDVAALRRLFGRARQFLCQTEEAAAAIRGFVGSNAPDKIGLLPPMVPALDETPRRLKGPPRLGYAGKFSPPYRILETLDAFEEIRRRRPDAEFHVVGDKFHNVPPRPGFDEEVGRRLRTTPGVVWHGGLDRDGTAAVLASVHVASSWRDATFDDSVEVSTKVLEYASLGIPVLLNPTILQLRLLGESYPGFVDSEPAFVERFLDLTSSASRYTRLSASVREAAAPFTFAATIERLLPVIEHETRRVPPKRRLRILFAGHDFKFVRPLVTHYEHHPDFRVLTDEYRGHVIGNTTRSARLLREADVVFCEWALGNAEWYSQHKRPDQTLIVRLHRQELTVPYLDSIEWDAVDAICFICSHTREQFLERFPGLERKAKLIYNLIDARALSRPKRPDAEFTLGLLGSAPRLKAPHLALEIVQRLRAVDERYRLRIKGKHPREYDWLWRRPDEREYYEQLYEQFDLPENAGAVVFDEHGDDVPDWFTQVGFVLSTSDYEGSHQAVAEGMAAGSIPIIRNWIGADRLYPARYVFASVDQAVDLVRRWSDPAPRELEQEACRELACRHFHLTEITEQYDSLIARLRSRTEEAVAA
jgi:glycosyltransferase involved in cell wall biosynthesis